MAYHLSALSPQRLIAPSRRTDSGQTFAEMLLIMPMICMLAAGAIAIVYFCWQGIKVQQAANLAARIQGQERVAGGPDAGSIRQVNGLGMGGDEDVTSANGAVDSDSLRAKNSNNLLALPSASVYGKYRQMVRGMFGAGETPHLFVPPPVLGANTDQVKVTRIMSPPKFLGLQLKPVVVEGTAYGGEDSHMYSLPRWGCVGGQGCDATQPYWRQILKGTDNN